MLSNLDLPLLLENLPAGVVVYAANSQIVYVNPEAERILGVPSAQLVGRLADDPSWELRGSDDRPLPVSGHPFERVMADGKPLNNMVLGVTFGTAHQLRWVVVSAYLDKHSPERFVVVTFTELSRQRPVPFQEAFELVDEAIVITSADPSDRPWPRITYVNAAFCTLSGYSSVELLGETPRILQGEGTDRAALDRIREALVDGRPIRETLLNYNKVGKPYWLDISISPLLDSRGRITHFIALERDVSHLKQEAISQRRAAERDPLTHLRNRRGFKAALKGLMANGRIGRSRFSVITLDIDHFKRINDSLGHAKGDIVLTKLGEILRTSLRRNDVVARFGGEEFVVLLPDTDLDIAYQAAERLREAVMAIDTPTTFTISLGVACSGPQERFESVLLRADRALYTAKESGRNRTERAPEGPSTGPSV